MEALKNKEIILSFRVTVEKCFFV